MAGKREKPEDIVSKSRQVEVLQGQGMTTADAVRQIGVTQQTYYRWRKQFGGIDRRPGRLTWVEALAGNLWPQRNPRDPAISQQAPRID